jgi:hypothetical protein
VREHYNVERDDNLKLRDFPTLRHVAGWVRGKARAPRAAHPQPRAAAGSPGRCPVAEPRHTPPAPPLPPACAASDDGHREGDRHRRRPDRLPGRPAGPDLDLEADLGVDTVKQAEVFAAVREHYDVERDDER